MKVINRATQRFLLATILSLSLLSAVALAGPPLICHPFEIDGANSLPWISHDWNLSGSENYDTSKLASDTIAILDSSNVTLVHMETLRRGNDPQMEFAAALISVGNASINGQEHAEKALAGAKNDSLLARNLSAHFLGAQSETLSAMITRAKMAAKTDKD